MLVYKKKKHRTFKSPKQLERHSKGVANHRRIEILFLISGEPGITVENISSKLDCNVKTISGHTQRLVQAGLVRKKYRGREVTHDISPYGKIFLDFLKTFSHS